MQSKGGMVKFLKYLFVCSLIITTTSCGGDSTDEETDGVGLSEHRIFVTSTNVTNGNIVNGSLTSAIAADEFCKNAAVGAGLVRDYRAIISTPNETAIVKLFVIGGVFKVDSSGNKIQVATSESTLFDASVTPLLSSVDLDESGNLVATNEAVWTGSTSEGLLGNFCGSDWDSTSGTATAGRVGQVNGEWIEDPINIACSTSARIYCVSQ